MKRVHALLIALGIAALYVGVAGFTAGRLLPVRPVYEGFQTIAPYNWVTPPANRKADNLPPSKGNGKLVLGPKGTDAGTIATDDNQAVMTFFKGSFPARKGEKDVRVQIRPLDPATLTKAPPALYYDGNAYEFSATYEPSGRAAVIPAKECPLGQNPKICPTIVLRYAFKASALEHLDGTIWSPVNGATPVSTSLQIFGDVPTLGTFVAVDKTSTQNAKSPGRSSVGGIVSISLAAGAILVGLVASRIRNNRRARSRKRPPPKKKLPKR